MLHLDKEKAIEHMMRSRWRVTAFAATPGPGQHDVIFAEPHHGPVAALTAAVETMRMVHPDVDPDVLRWDVKPEHREKEANK